MRYAVTLLFFILSTTLRAQYAVKIAVKDEASTSPLAGATVRIVPAGLSVQTDSTGAAQFAGMPGGKHSIIVSYVGYREAKMMIQLPLADSLGVTFLLTADEEEEEEVIVRATRTSRTIANTPTRVEVISGEELEEKANMKPGDIRMMLNESTGIQTQQTSATSYNSSIRIQGLDGRYTQVLRDGYPAYAGFSSGLSIMQIAPLDLRQVEVIKGASSTLYGGGAIAGLVNLVSKTPAEDREILLMANATSAKGGDLSGFYSERYGKAGLTLFGSLNGASAYDPGKTGFTAIPEFTRFTIHPRLFLYGSRTTADVGVSIVSEDRVGGSVAYITNNAAGYFEKNITSRFTTTTGISHELAEGRRLYLKNSFSRFNRSITVPDHRFKGIQLASFTEAGYTHVQGNSEWIAGINVITEDFDESAATTSGLDYYNATLGAFLQNAWELTSQFTLETGMRVDYVRDYGTLLLPRVSMLYKPSAAVTMRLGGGAGYKTPTIFNEESESRQFRALLPLGNAVVNERSGGANFDINYRKVIGGTGISINQLFFYTRLRKPLTLQPAGGGFSRFLNAPGFIDTKGLETNVKVTHGDFKLFVGYTLADVNRHADGRKERVPLTARHRLNNVLMYEKEGEWKLGLEAYYTSSQTLNDNQRGQSFWTAGFMAEKLWERFSIFVNFENFGDTRQTRFDTIYTGPQDAPIFRDIYAPVDGFVVNGGVKVKL